MNIIISIHRVIQLCFWFVSLMCCFAFGQSLHPLESTSPYGFALHLEEAIAINEGRMPIYAQLTHGKSKRISRKLIAWEKGLLPYAYSLDRQAKKYQEEGIPIVQADFVPMDNLLAAETPPTYSGQASKATWVELSQALLYFKKDVRTAIKEENLYQVCYLVAGMIHRLEEIEQEGQCHFAMCKHLLESMGWIALNGITYIKLSEGKSFSLTKRLIMSHLPAIKFHKTMDGPAQDIHVMGVGILVNDLPHIPFLEKWEENCLEGISR